MGIRVRRAREDVGGLDLISESGGRLGGVLGNAVGDPLCILAGDVLWRV